MRRILPFLLGAAVLAAGPATRADSAESWPTIEPGTERWVFNVTLDGRDIGHHRFDRTQANGVEQVDIEARFKVKVLFVTAYRYAHDNTETWVGDCLRAIDSSTDDNGEPYLVTGQDAQTGFELLRNDEPVQLQDGCVQTFAYWNKDILQATELLNSQTGRLEPVNVDARGTRERVLAGGSVMAEEYVISTPNGDITVWYQEDNGQWLGLETLAKGNRVLRYEPEHLPSMPVSIAQSGQGLSPP